MKRRSLFKATGISLISGMLPQIALAESLECNGNDEHMIFVMFEVEYEDDQIQNRRDVILAMDKATTKEVDCIAYKSSFDANNSHVLRVTQIWDSMRAFRQHLGSQHATEYQDALFDLGVVSMDVRVHEIGEELPYPN